METHLMIAVMEQERIVVEQEPLHQQVLHHLMVCNCIMYAACYVLTYRLN